MVGGGEVFKNLIPVGNTVGGEIGIFGQRVLLVFKYQIPDKLG
jgi:hypothetical protein